jgi:hypothetical protein
MGDEADDIMAGFGLTEEDRKKYNIVKQKFEDHFVVRRNTIFERAKFNRRVQGANESVDSFITALYGLSEYCEFDALRDEMIRDRIVVGIKDENLSFKMQVNHALTLKKAIRYGQGK